MAAALALAARGLGRTWPNPAVGCVIERGGIVLGRGRTADGGRPHAEVAALSASRRRAGRNGPRDARALRPSRADPALRGRPRGRRRGAGCRGAPRSRSADGRRRIARVRAAGVEVVEGMLEREARELQAGFLSRVTRGRPMLTLKLATTLDGRIATASGESRWITGPAARAHVHAERASHDAVMIGAGPRGPTIPASTCAAWAPPSPMGRSRCASSSRGT